MKQKEQLNYFNQIANRFMAQGLDTMGNSSGEETQ